MPIVKRLAQTGMHIDKIEKLIFVIIDRFNGCLHVVEHRQNEN